MTRRRKIVSLVVVICLLPVLFVVRYLAWHLSMEKDPGGMFRAAARLQLSGAKITTVRSNPKQLLVRIKSLGPFRSNDVLESYLAQRGWTPSDRMGATYYFKQGKATLKVSLRPFTSFYRVCDLDKAP
jgi:hypothetical protein